MSLDLRDALIVANIVSMVGGAFYMVGMLRNEIRHLARAIEALNAWMQKAQDKLDTAAQELAALKAVSEMAAARARAEKG